MTRCCGGRHPKVEMAGGILAVGPQHESAAVGYGAFIVSPLTIGLLAQATSLRLALALLVVTSLAIAGLATRWPTASTPPGRGAAGDAGRCGGTAAPCG